MKRTIEFPSKSRDKEVLPNSQEGVIPNLQCNKRNPKIHQKKQKGNWAKPAKEKEKLSFDFFGPGSLATILFSVV